MLPCKTIKRWSHFIVCIDGMRWYSNIVSIRVLMLICNRLLVVVWLDVWHWRWGIIYTTMYFFVVHTSRIDVFAPSMFIATVVTMNSRMVERGWKFVPIFCVWRTITLNQTDWNYWIFAQNAWYDVMNPLDCASYYNRALMKLRCSS